MTSNSDKNRTQNQNGKPKDLWVNQQVSKRINYCIYAKDHSVYVLKIEKTPSILSKSKTSNYCHIADCLTIFLETLNSHELV